MCNCSICNKEFSSKQALGGHITLVHSNIDWYTIRHKKKLERVEVEKECPKCHKIFIVIRSIKDNIQHISKDEKTFCSRKCANSKLHSSNTKQKIKESLVGRVYPLRRKTYKCVVCGKKLRKYGKYSLCKECYHKSELCSLSLKGKTGGYRKGGGRSKGGYYKEAYFDSQFEIDVAIFLDEHNILWKRNTKRFYFSWKGKETYYIPDFYFPEIDVYLETKGYYWKDKREKTLYAVEVNNLQWFDLMFRNEWDKDRNILLEKLKRYVK